MEANLDMTLRCAGERVDHDRKHIWQWQVNRVWRAWRRCLVLKVDLIEKGVSKGSRTKFGKRSERLKGGNGSRGVGHSSRQQDIHLIIEERLHERLRRPGSTTRLALVGSHGIKGVNRAST